MDDGKIEEEKPKDDVKDFCEADVGIQEFLSPSPLKICCTIKHRYSDFIVNEID